MSQRVFNSKLFMEKALNGISDAIVLLEPVFINEKVTDFKYVLVNNSGEKMMGKAKSKLLGHTVMELFPGTKESGMLDKYISTFSNGVEFEEEFYYEYEGFNHWFRQKGIKVSNSILIITSDITKDKSNELNLKSINQNLETSNQKLIRTNNDLDNFVYAASHDLKAPLYNLESLIELLKDHCDQYKSKNDEIDKIFYFLEESIKTFKSLLGDLSELAKINSGTGLKESLKILEVLDEVKSIIKPLIGQSDAKLIIELDDCPEIIVFSKANLKIILYNLISNAIKYRDPFRQPEVHVSYQLLNGEMVLKFKDNGLGIPADKMNELFTIFKRFHKHIEGTGLGLYIVKKIIENVNGRIEVNSKVGEGTEFKIYFENKVL